MARAGGDALAWAEDLWRHPASRHALRAQPLPDGIEQLLSMATGSGAALAQAAAEAGESPARLLEVVRFALREQLFFPGADAYRTLGLSRTAPTEAVRSHHRLLQQWLHPDRCSGEDAVFAARVNAAWDRVRTAERRHAYDASLGDTPHALQPPTGTTPGAVVWRQEALGERDLRAFRWRQRAPLIALLAACIGLGALAVLDQARQPAMYTDSRDAPPGQDPVAALVLPPPRQTEAIPARRSAEERLRREPRPAAPRAAVATGEPDTRPIPVPADEAAAVLPKPPPRVLPPAASVADVGSPRPATAPSAPPPPAVPSPPVPAQPQPSRAVPQIALAAQPAPSAAAAPPPRPATAAPLDPRRVRAAERVWTRLLLYLEGRGGRVPPIWDSLGVQQGAESMRMALAAEPPSSLVTPTWRISGESASVDAGLVYKDGNAGRLRARLVWREERWLVADVAMERDR